MSMFKRLKDFLTSKSGNNPYNEHQIEIDARQVFEQRQRKDAASTTATLEKDSDGNYMNQEVQAAWAEFLDDYIKSTWW